jgi:hypothetical protein
MAISQRGTGAFVACVVVALYCAMGWTKSEPSDEPSRTWRPDNLGLSLVAPIGWSEVRPGGAWCLARDPADSLAGFLRVEVEPDPLRCDTEHWLLSVRDSLEFENARTIDRWDVSEVAGSPLARIAWHGTPAGSAAPMRGELVACDRGDSKVIVEVLARVEAWPAIEREVDQLFTTLSIERR